MKSNLLITLVASLAMIIATAAPSHADTLDDPALREEPQPAFCGVNSLYTALRIIGINADLRSLLSRKYISSSDGSTYADLMQACDDQRASAEVFENLSYNDLAAIRQPCILHVRPEYDSQSFSHFVLVVSPPKGNPILYDAPTPPRPVSAAELAALWDGSAMIVGHSRASLPAMSQHLRGPIKLAAFSAAALLMLMLIRSYMPQWPRIGAFYRLPLQVGLLVSAALSMTLIFHSFSDSGYFKQGSIVQMIAKSRYMSPARKLDLAQFRDRLTTGAAIVDARFTSDFQDGHVPNALNIPPDTSHVDRGRLLHSVDHNTLIVVYCAGPACPYATILANRLTRDGFQSVEVFTGGWEEWSGSVPTFTSIAENK